MALQITRRDLAALATGGLLVLAGCSRGKRAEDFTPAADNARRALEAALKYWQEGHPPGTVPGTAPVVEVIDTKWKGGQKLQTFEILQEETPGPGPRYFTVRITPPRGAPQEVRYVIVGIDPIWVYREADYKKIAGAGM
jgi:hypothetical protein